MQHKPKMTESRYWIIMSIQDNHGDLNEVMMTDHVWWQRHTCAQRRTNATGSCTRSMYQAPSGLDVLSKLLMESECRPRIDRHVINKPGLFRLMDLFYDFTIFFIHLV